MAQRGSVVKEVVLPALEAVERGVDQAWLEWRKRHGRLGPLVIQPYRGYGTEWEVLLSARVLEAKSLWKAKPTDRPWRNALAMYHRFTTREITGVRVRAWFEGAVEDAISDEEGYCHFRLEPKRMLPQGDVWHDVSLELVGAEGMDVGSVRATGCVLVPPVGSEFGVISDMDDTVLRTGVTKRWAMLKTTFLHNAHTRLPFKGVAGFYRALQRGPTGSGHNPIFYVSNGPWNLYDLLVDFLTLQGIPLGPLFLQDMGIDRDTLISDPPLEHKRLQIDRILNTYPRLPFLLIGDSGQQDPEVYREAARRHPGRIRAIYIRDVSPEMRDMRVDAITEEVRALGTELVRVADSEAAAEHAINRGFMEPRGIVNVRAEKAKDKRPKPGLRGMVRSVVNG
ncbi:MAG TPA: phosphatase domain-containing protein [Rhodothermales bacterium]|nr:phosphatase domain-containing protein [Rhodothermales bacterium]